MTFSTDLLLRHFRKVEYLPSKIRLADMPQPASPRLLGFEEEEDQCLG
jgi:hypothetical protein